MIYFTSDTHLGHLNIIHFGGRDYETIEHMNRFAIAAWNSRVTNEDTVYHLGDFAMGHRILIPEYLEQLAGTIVLIAGNHDLKRDDHYFPTVIRPSMFLEHEGVTIELIHNPRQMAGTGDITFCGHMHDAWAFTPKGTVIPGSVSKSRRYNGEPPRVSLTDVYNVGVDVRGFTPLTFEEIMRAPGREP